MYYGRNASKIMSNKSNKKGAVKRQKQVQKRKQDLDKRKAAIARRQLSYISHAQHEMEKEPSERVSIPRRSISLRVPAPMLDSLDYLALERGITRTELILAAFDAYIPDRMK